MMVKIKGGLKTSTKSKHALKCFDLTHVLPRVSLNYLLAETVLPAV